MRFKSITSSFLRKTQHTIAKLFFIFFLSSIAARAEQLSIDISAPAAILINGENGNILFEKNARVPTFPASVTKVATALYLLNLNKNLDELVTVKQEAVASITPQAKKDSNYRSPAYWLETDAMHMGLKKGEMISLRDLLHGMLIPSANDAANVIAQHVAHSIPEFVNDLNQFVKKIGCKDTFFCNPHGLHHPKHLSTPLDMAIIAMEAMKYPIFKEIVSLPKYTCAETNLQSARHLVQTNHLVRPGKYFYSKAIGIKTGYHSLAGKTLIAGAKNQSRFLICVLFGSTTLADRYKDATKLFEAAFNEQKFQKKMLAKGVQEISLKTKDSKKIIKTYLNEDLVYEYYPSEEEAVQLTAQWNHLSFPILKDQIIGKVRIQNQKQQTIKELPLISVEHVESHFFFNLSKYFKLNWILLSAALLLVLFIFYRKIKNSRYG